MTNQPVSAGAKEYLACTFLEEEREILSSFRLARVSLSQMQAQLQERLKAAEKSANARLDSERNGIEAATRDARNNAQASLSSAQRSLEATRAGLAGAGLASVN